MSLPAIISKRVKSPLYTISYIWTSYGEGKITDINEAEIGLESISFLYAPNKPIPARIYRWVDESTHNTTLVCYKEDEKALTEYAKDTRQYYRGKSAKALEDKIQ